MNPSPEITNPEPTPPAYPDAVPVAEWAFLQAEAISVLEAQGFPPAKTPQFARSKIRAYVLARLIEIVGKPAANRSVEEQAAYDRLREAMQDNRVALAQNAVRYWESLNAGNPCFSGGNPASGIYVPPNFIVSRR